MTRAYDKAHKRGDELGMACRTQYIRRNTREYQAFRFKEPDQAEAMAAEFGGETYYALDRGKGSGWEKWRKKIRPRLLVPSPHRRKIEAPYGVPLELQPLSQPAT